MFRGGEVWVSERKTGIHLWVLCTPALSRLSSYFGRNPVSDARPCSRQNEESAFPGHVKNPCKFLWSYREVGPLPHNHPHL